MKKAAAILLAAILLTGCSRKPNEIQRALALRTKLLSAESCSFDASITADYGDKIHMFTLECKADDNGDLHFCVAKPDSISGIEGVIDGKDGKITFDDKALFFPLLADDQIAPVTAPWILAKTLRSGYLTSAMVSGDLLRLSIDDSYADDALHLDIWLDENNIPLKSEVLFRDRKILSIDVKNFRIE